MKRHERMISTDVFPDMTTTTRYEQKSHHPRSNSLTMDCEEWTAGSMSRFQEVNVACAPSTHHHPQALAATQTTSTAHDGPRCDSPLPLDQDLLLDGICFGEGI